MSNADEIIKLKKLLDENIITEEEFEKKKNDLLGKNLNENVINNSNTNNIKNNEIKRKSKKKVFLVIIIVLLIYSFGMNMSRIAKNGTQTTYNSPITTTLINDFSFSNEEATEIVNVLNECNIKPNKNTYSKTNYSITDVTAETINGIDSLKNMR